MSLERDFYLIAHREQITAAEFKRNNELYPAMLYIEKLCLTASKLGLDDFPEIPYPLPQGSPVSQSYLSEIVDWLFSIERYLNQLYADNLFEIEGVFAQGEDPYVQLDDDWRSKVNSYIAHAKDAVINAEIEEARRESILGKLLALEKEVQRNRTRIAAATEVWLELTKAAGEGAKNLKPVVELINKVAGSFGRLKESEDEATHAPRLPAPEELGLEDFSDDE